MQIQCYQFALLVFLLQNFKLPLPMLSPTKVCERVAIMRTDGRRFSLLRKWRVQAELCCNATDRLMAFISATGFCLFQSGVSSGPSCTLRVYETAQRSNIGCCFEIHLQLWCLWVCVVPAGVS